MKVSIVTFADLGKYTNLKTMDIAPVIEALLQRSSIERIVCRRNNGFSFTGTVGVISAAERYIVKAIELISQKRITLRRYEEWKLDRVAPKAIGNPDIVLFHPEYFFSTAIDRIKKRNPKIITVAIATMAHLQTNARLEREEFEILQIGNHKKYGLYQQLLDRNPALNDFDYIIALSDFVKQSYIDAGFPADKIFVAYTDIDLASFVSVARKPDGIFRAVYVAFTSPLKGLHYLLDAWNKAHLSNSELLVVGNYRDDMPDSLKKEYELIASRNSSITFIPSIAHADMPDLYSRASVFVFPSLTEGNSRAVMEALSAGVPVITTDHASSIVVNRETGYIVPIRDSQALQEKITMLHDHPDMVLAMGIKARQVIEQKQSFGEQVVRILEKL